MTTDPQVIVALEQLIRETRNLLDELAIPGRSILESEYGPPA